MRNGKWVCAWSLVLAAVLTPQALGAFTSEIADNDNSQAWQIAGDSAWQGQQKCGGLGFEVTVGDWPRLFQRGHTDMIGSSSTYGAKRGTTLYNDATRYLDLGQIRTTSSGTVTPSVSTQNWCYRKYAAGTGGTAMDFYISRVTPAVLVNSSSSSLYLFSGTKKVGQRWSGSAWVETSSVRVPTYCAYVNTSGVVVKQQTNQTISNLNNLMGESWMLFWHGSQSEYVRPNLPGVLFEQADNDMFDAFLQTQGFTSVDCPVLVVFQNKPTQIAPGGDNALQVSFSSSAGAVSVLPLYGFYHVEAATTQGWYSSFPADLKSRCQAWASRLKEYPLACSESKEVTSGAQGNGEIVKIRHVFSYLSVADQWGTTSVRVAPASPAAALADTYSSLQITFSGTLLNYAIPTISGPYTGVSGTDTIDTTVTGLHVFVDNMVTNPAASGEGTAIAAEMDSHVDAMLARGPNGLAPAWQFGRMSINGSELHFMTTGETILALADAYPYLDTASKNAAYAYAQSEYGRAGANPLTASSTSDRPSGTAQREGYTAVTHAQWSVFTDGSWATSRNISGDQRADSIYSIWAMCKAANNWALADTAWSTIKTTADTWAAKADWATMGFFGIKSGPAHVFAGNVGMVNGRIGRYIGHARLAIHYGASEISEKDQAIYRLARAAINRVAAGKYLQYAYTENFIVINPGSAGSAWMDEYSQRGNGAGGDGRLWANPWSTYSDDPRTVIDWNELGPELYQDCGTANNDWTAAVSPVMSHFQNLSPECGRLLGTYGSAELTTYYNAVKYNVPDWFLVGREAYLGMENHVDSAANSYSIVLGKAYALNTPFTEMVTFLDCPFWKYGDLYHLRRLSAILRTNGGLSWQNAN